MTDQNINVLRTFSDYSEEVNLQFIKFAIPQEHPWVEKEIRNITLPPDTLIVMLLRDGKRVVPNGKTVLSPNDIAILSAYKCYDEFDFSLLEQQIVSDSEWIGKTIEEFSPHADELVIMIIRSGKTILPKGKTKIKENDILVIHSDVTGKKQTFFEQ